jgi:CheY-like chemotaxis protein
VLVVDDVETNLYVAQGLLQPYGLTVDCVKSGQEAIDRMKDAAVTYDMIFMDHMMPEMDGIKAAGIIRAMDTDYTRLPIVALTANAIVGMREMFLEQGFNDFLSKPISRPNLDEILVKWIPREKQQPAAPGLIPAVSEAVPGDAPAEELSIEGVDTHKGITLVGGSRPVYCEVLTVFSRDAAGRLDLLQRVPTLAELPSFTTQVHALKSAAASIGAAAVAQRAASLEAGARQGDLAAINGQLAPFALALEALVQNIRASLHLDEAEAAWPSNGPVEMPQAVQELLTQLRAALQAEEIRPIDLFLDSLKNTDLSPPLRQAASAISNCVLISEFGEAVEIIDRLV